MGLVTGLAPRSLALCCEQRVVLARVESLVGLSLEMPTRSRIVNSCPTLLHATYSNAVRMAVLTRNPCQDFIAPPPCSISAPSQPTPPHTSPLSPPPSLFQYQTATTDSMMPCSVRNLRPIGTRLLHGLDPHENPHNPHLGIHPHSLTYSSASTTFSGNSRYSGVSVSHRRGDRRSDPELKSSVHQAIRRHQPGFRFTDASSNMTSYSVAIHTRLTRYRSTSPKSSESIQ